MNKLKSTSRALYVIAGMFAGIGFEHINIPNDSVLISGTFIVFFFVLAFASLRFDPRRRKFMTTTASPLSDAQLERFLFAAKHRQDNEGDFWKAKDILSLLATIAYLTQQLADLRAKPAGELYTHGYFGDRSRAGELAPGYGDKEPAPVDDAELVRLCDRALTFNHHIDRMEKGSRAEAAVIARALKSRLHQPAAPDTGDRESLAVICWDTPRSYYSWSSASNLARGKYYDMADAILAAGFSRRKVDQPARQPVTREEMFAAFNAAEKLWMQDVQSDKTQWEYYYDAIQALLEGRV